MPGKKKQTKQLPSPRREGDPNANNPNNNNSAENRQTSPKELSQKIDECCELICSNDDEKIKKGLEELIRLKKEFNDKLDLNSIKVMRTNYPLLGYVALTRQDSVATLMLLTTEELEIDPNKTIMPLKRPLIHYVCSDERPEAFAISGLLINHGTTIDPNDDSTIRAATQSGHINVLEWVLKNNPAVVHKIYRDKNATCTLLFDTLDCKDISKIKVMIDLLLKHGADINQKCTIVMQEKARDQAHDVTLLQRLYLARDIARHTEDFLVFLVEKNADFNLLFANGRTPFQQACQSGHLDAIKAMLAKDMLAKEDIVNQPFANGFPPIFWACQTDNLALFNLLIENGAAINGTAQGLTLLEYAAAQGAYKIAKRLIEEFKFDVDSPHTKGTTPLFWAIKGNSYPVVQLLLEKNANPNQVMGNDTILGIAVTALSKASSASEIKEVLNIISELLKYKALTTLEQSAIIFKQACKEKNLTVITQILQANNNSINKSISITDTFLTYAIQTKNAAVIKTVLAAGDVSAEPIDTPALVIAACRENVELEIIKALLKDGKDKLPMNQLIIALDVAISYGNTAVTNFFIEQDPQGIAAHAREIGNTRVLDAVSKYSPKHLQRLNVCCKLICTNNREIKQKGIEELIKLKKELGSQLDLNSIKVMGSDFPLLGYIADSNQGNLTLSLLWLKQNELGIDVNETEMPDGRSFLSWTCAKSTRADIATSSWLILHGATIDANDDDTIRSAIRNGHLEVLERYLENNPTAVSKIYTDTNGETSTLLFETLKCVYSDTIKDMVELLLKHKANINQKYTIIHHQKLQSVTLLQQLFLERPERKDVDVNYMEYLVKFLVERNADFNSKIEGTNTTPFQIACTFGYLESIKLMLAHGASKNQIFSNGLTPLFCACEVDNVEAFNFLLSQGADINYKDPAGLTVFDFACAQGAYEIAKQLIEEFSFDVNLPSATGLTPLYSAVSAKNYYLMQLLLRNNANPNRGFGEDNEAIICLVIKLLTEDANAFGVDSFEVIKELLKYGVKPINALAAAIACKNTQITNFLLAKDLQNIAAQACEMGNVDVMDAVMNYDLEQQNPVIQDSILSYAMLACQRGHKNILEFFIKNGLINNIDETRDNYTLLYIAAEAGKEDVVKFLLDNRATSGQACTDANMTALHIACQNGHVGVVDVLLSKGAKKFIYCKDQITPLSLAFHYEHFAVVDKLCSDDDINDRDMFLTQTLLHACQQGDLALIQYLQKKHGPFKLNSSIEKGMTPLHIACQYGHREIVDWLLDKQIDINRTNAAGETPLHIACQYAQNEIAVMLIRRGADVKLSTHIAGETPLYLACANNEIRSYVVEALLDAGADVDQKHSRKESTPREIALERTNETVSALIKNWLSPLEKMLGRNDTETNQKFIADFINNSDLKDTGVMSFLNKIVNDKSSQTVLLAERFDKLLPHIHALKRRVIVNELEKYKKQAQPVDVIVDSAYQSKQEIANTSKPKTESKSTTIGSGWENSENNNNAFVSAHKFFKDSGGTDEEWKRQKEQERKNREEAEKASKKIVTPAETEPKITHVWGDVTSDMPEIKQVSNAAKKNRMFYCPEELITAEFDLFKFDEDTVSTLGKTGGRGIKHIGDQGTVDIEFAGKKYYNCKVKYEYKIKSAKHRLFLVKLPADDNTGVLYVAFLFHKALHSNGAKVDLKNMFRKMDNQNQKFSILPPKSSLSSALSPEPASEGLRGTR